MPKDFKISLNSVELLLNEDNTVKVEILKTGHIKKYKVNIEKHNIDDIIKNFNESDKKELPVNFDHDRFNIASGWIKNLKIEKKGKKSILMASIEFTTKAAKNIREKEYKFISAELSGGIKNLKLVGAALTNLPAVIGMQAITLSEEEKGFITNFNNYKKVKNMEDLKKSFMVLSDEDKEKLKEELYPKSDEDKVKEAKDAKKAEDDKKNKDSEDKDSENKDSENKDSEEAKESEKVKELSKRISKMEKVSNLKNKESEFMILLSEKKVVPAQKDAFLKGDISEFAKNSAEMHLDASGSGQGKDASKEKTVEDKLIKLSNEKIADAKKEGTILTVSDATLMVLSENPDLSIKYRG